MGPGLESRIWSVKEIDVEQLLQEVTGVLGRYINLHLSDSTELLNGYRKEGILCVV